MILDPTNATRLYYGTNRVYRSTNGTSWSVISPDLTNGPGSGSSGQVYGTLTTLAVSPLDGGVIWAGSDDGRVHVSTNSGSSWTDVSTALPDRWITSVRTDPVTREVAYVTVSGFRWGSPLPHVFRTANLGATWSAIASNLPEAPANDLAVDPANPSRLFVATDLGVYESFDLGGSWHALGSNLPNVVVTVLAVQSSTRQLIAGTYGRSFWSYDLDQPSAAPEPALASLGELLPPAPNPARGPVELRYSVTAPGTLRFEIVTPAGRRVLTREVTAARAGAGSFRFDGRDAERGAASGGGVRGPAREQRPAARGKEARAPAVAAGARGPGPGAAPRAQAPFVRW